MNISAPPPAPTPPAPTGRAHPRHQPQPPSTATATASTATASAVTQSFRSCYRRDPAFTSTYQAAYFLPCFPSHASPPRHTHTHKEQELAVEADPTLSWPSKRPSQPNHHPDKPRYSGYTGTVHSRASMHRSKPRLVSVGTDDTVVQTPVWIPGPPTVTPPPAPPRRCAGTTATAQARQS